MNPITKGEMQDLLGKERVLKELGSLIEPNQRGESLAGYTPFAPRYEVPALDSSLEPKYELKNEKFEHRMAALLKAGGFSNDRIAAELGYCTQHISDILKQPRAQELILNRLHGSGDKAMQRLQEETLAAAERIIEISRTANNAATRLQANNSILDRKYGKPNQPYSVASKTAEAFNDLELVKIIKEN